MSSFLKFLIVLTCCVSLLFSANAGHESSKDSVGSLYLELLDEYHKGLDEKFYDFYAQYSEVIVENLMSLDVYVIDPKSTDEVHFCRNRYNVRLLLNEVKLKDKDRSFVSSILSVVNSESRQDLEDFCFDPVYIISLTLQYDPPVYFLLGDPKKCSAIRIFVECDNRSIDLDADHEVYRFVSRVEVWGQGTIQANQ